MNQSPLFTTVIDQWLAKHSDQLTSSSTVKYAQLIQNHIAPFFQGITCQSLTENVLDHFYQSVCARIEDEHLSNGNMRTVFMIINHALEYGYKKRYLEQKFYLKPRLSRQKPIVHVFSSSEQAKIEQYIMQHRDPYSLAILLALYSGLRIGELCALKWNDIDFENASLRITKTVQRLRQSPDENGRKTTLLLSSPKSSSSYRVIPLPRFVIDYMKNFYSLTKVNCYLLSDCEQFPLDPRTLQYAYKKILRQIQVPYLNFHCLRHTFATRCVMIGWDVKTLSEVLGHSEIKITMDYYFHSSFEYKRTQMEKLSLLTQK